MNFVSSKDNLADIFTNPLPVPLFSSIVRKLMAVLPPICLRRDVEDKRNGAVSSQENGTREAEKEEALTRDNTYSNDNVSPSRPKIKTITRLRAK